MTCDFVKRIVSSTMENSVAFTSQSCKGNAENKENILYSSDSESDHYVKAEDIALVVGSDGEEDKENVQTTKEAENVEEKEDVKVLINKCDRLSLEVDEVKKKFTDLEKENGELNSSLDKLNLEHDRIQNLSKGLDNAVISLENENEQLEKRIIELEKQNTKLTKELRLKERDIKDLQDELQATQDSSRIFSDNSIYDTNMRTGSSRMALRDALEVISHRPNLDFYIGATSNPDDRMRAHRKKGYTQMYLLYRTQCYDKARDFEANLLNEVFWANGCCNKVKTSMGLVATKNVFYIYMLQ